MLEETKRTVHPIYQVYDLLQQPFRSPDAQNKGLLEKVFQSLLNCKRAFMKEVFASQGAYLFPLFGIGRFFSMPGLHSMLFGSLITGVAVTIAVTVVLFIFAWTPQFAILSFIVTPFLAFPAAVLLVLAESWYISYTIAKLTWMDDLQDRVFDQVLKDEIKKQSGGGISAELVEAINKKSPKNNLASGKLLGRIKHFPKAIVDDTCAYVATLPLNFIPGVGTAFFLYLNAESLAVKLHARYFEAKGWNTDPQKIRRFVEENESAYRAFGIVSMMLNLVPILNVVFALTNTAGAALWACDIERRLEAKSGLSKAGGIS